MSNTLDDRSGLTQAFNALWELATPEQREHFKQDEITPKRLSEAITEARIDEHMKWVLPTTEQALEWEQSEDGSGIQYFDNKRLGRLNELKENN